MGSFNLEGVSFNAEVVKSFKDAKAFAQSSLCESLYLEFEPKDKAQLLEKVYTECKTIGGEYIEAVEV